MRGTVKRNKIKSDSGIKMAKGTEREAEERFSRFRSSERRLFIFVRTIATDDAANAGVTGQVDTSLSVRPVADEEAQRGVSSSLLAGQGACAAAAAAAAATWCFRTRIDEWRERERKRETLRDRERERKRERVTRRFPDKDWRDEDKRIDPSEYQWRTRRGGIEFFTKNGYIKFCAIIVF